ncbi:hypothetical protein [Nocardia sp. bgisy118]|uniref:hypothetical protein n=1 Tax=Nocardia sp. bgisy118 TaxID=3413786 RepID=UPI003F4A7943
MVVEVVERYADVVRLVGDAPTSDVPGHITIRRDPATSTLYPASITLATYWIRTRLWGGARWTGFPKRWVNATWTGGHTATYEYRLRGFESYVFRFDSGALTVDPAEPGPIDVYLSIEPVTALLLNYGRIGQVRPALSGRVLAWGRKPCLAQGFRVASYRLDRHSTTSVPSTCAN